MGAGKHRLKRPLLLVGCGKMGGAMLSGWLKAGIAPAGVHIVDPAEAPDFVGRRGVEISPAFDDLAESFDPEVVVLAVKPQQMDDVALRAARFTKPGTVFLSIAAGKTLGYFARYFGERAAIVRAMPNTPAAIGLGITVACPNSRVDDSQAAICSALLSAVGETLLVEDEALLDPVTALSGSGPAYVFLLIECMAEAGVAVGLPPEVAARLALVTVAGAGQLAMQGDLPPEQLRRNVTSPGGTTEAALKELMSGDGLRPLMIRAIEAATRRSRELAG